MLRSRRNGGGLVARLKPLDDLHLHGEPASHGDHSLHSKHAAAVERNSFEQPA